jgi:hypothetical protein
MDKKVEKSKEDKSSQDGAELAYELQKLTPFHSLHAGRYSALGIDVGHQVKFETARLEEESQDRIHILFSRSRPGKVKNTGKN